MGVRRRFGSWLSWLPWYRRGARDAELARELRDHLELEAEEQRAAGLPAEEAGHAAHRALGNTLKIEEDVRTAWGFQWLETVVQDARYGLRVLRKSPGFTAVAVLTLALGIGANTAIFSATYSILLKPLPYKDSDRLVTVTAIEPGGGPEGSLLSIPAVQFIRERTQVFAEVTAVEAQRYRLTGLGMPEILDSGLVSGDYFTALGVDPVRGRMISLSDVRGEDHVAVLSYKFWQKHFGGDTHVVGKQMDLANAPNSSAVPTPYTVIGIAPPSFISPGYGWDYDVWLPQVGQHGPPEYLGGDDFTVAWLQRGVTLREANAQLKSLSALLGEAYPQTAKGWTLHAQRLQDTIVGRSRLGLLVLLGAVGFLLLIACGNVSSLVLARTWGRLREIAVREAVGASRSRILRQLLTETLLLFLVGCGFGLVLARWAVALLRAYAPPYPVTPRVGEIALYAPVFWYAVGISVVAAVAFGLLPALQVTGRKLSVRLNASGVTSVCAGGERRHHGYRRALVITEVSLSFALLIGSGLLLRSFAKLVS